MASRMEEMEWNAMEGIRLCGPVINNLQSLKSRKKAKFMGKGEYCNWH